MSAKVYWLSRHRLSPAQEAALRCIHGVDVEIVHEDVVFMKTMTPMDYIRAHPDGRVYLVTSARYLISLTLSKLPFGCFENDPEARLNGTFALAAVFYVHDGIVEELNFGGAPTNDEGERLDPTRRNYE